MAKNEEKTEKGNLEDQKKHHIRRLILFIGLIIITASISVIFLYMELNQNTQSLVDILFEFNGILAGIVIILIVISLLGNFYLVFLIITSISKIKKLTVKIEQKPGDREPKEEYYEPDANSLIKLVIIAIRSYQFRSYGQAVNLFLIIYYFYWMTSTNYKPNYMFNIRIRVMTICTFTLIGLILNIIFKIEEWKYYFNHVMGHKEDFNKTPPLEASVKESYEGKSAERLKEIGNRKIKDFKIFSMLGLLWSGIILIEIFFDFLILPLGLQQPFFPSVFQIVMGILFVLLYIILFTLLVMKYIAGKKVINQIPKGEKTKKKKKEDADREGEKKKGKSEKQTKG
jgi:Na+-transporting methylmalonyl-CoA/oxaloacetate decarboxylase gamma subunit